MKSEESDTATGMSDENEQVVGSEQTTEKATSFEDQLMRVAAEDGLIGEPPEAETEVKPTEPEVKEPETEIVAETEPEEPEEPKEEEKPSAEKKDEKLVPLSEVLAERAKKKRAQERADKAEALAEQFKAQLSQVAAPIPTEDNPFVDVQDVNALDRLERSYEKTIDLADENPDGAVDVIIGRGPDGKELRKDFTPEELVSLRKKADKAIRKFIPERRTYLQQRAIADAQALEVYPELKDPESEFTKTAAVLAQRLFSGQSMKDPELLVWIGHAVKGYQDSLKRNGHAETQVKSPEAKRIVESAKTRVAPTPTRSRQFVERGTSSSKNLEKAAKRLEETGSKEDAEELVAAIFSQRASGPKRLEPIAE